MARNLEDKQTNVPENKTSFAKEVTSVEIMPFGQSPSWALRLYHYPVSP